MMPAHFGPVNFGPKNSGWYRDVTMMVVSYLTNREKLAAYLPESLEVGEEALITVAYARNRDVDWLAGHGYNLISVSASVVFNGEKGQIPGSYTLVMWENLTDPILSGREMSGIPKIFADIPDHSIADGEWRCQASHFGHRIMDISISDLKAPTSEEIADGLKAQEAQDNPIGWRYLPAVGGFGTRVSELTLFPSEILYKEVLVGEGKIDWNHLSWEQNPTQFHIVNALADLPILEYRPAIVTKGSANLFLPERPTRVLWSADTNPQAATSTKPIDEIKKVCFVGAGTMGCFNSLVAAICGYEVVIYDITPENLKKVPIAQQEMAAFLVGSGYCPPEAIAEALDRISIVGDLEAATANVDLVSESVFERLDIKRDIHQQLDKLCSPTTILTTNTSTLLVSDIEDAIQGGDRFAALHSHLGAPLIDIVGGPRTSPTTIDILKRYVLSLKGIPLVLKKEHKGYVFNAMIGPLLTTAMTLVIQGIATRDEVDRAWMLYRKAPMGPFGMMDLFGLNLILDTWQHQSGDDNFEELKSSIISFITPYLERGELGMKTGKGFYDYPNPAYGQPAFLEADSDVSIPHYAMTLALIQNGILLALKEVAEPEEIDRAWMAATSLDSGPFGILDQMGIDEFVKLSGSMESMLPPEDAKSVDAYLQQFVSRQELGEKSGKGVYTYPDPQYRHEGFLQGI